MARIRSVHPGFFKDEDIVELTDSAQLLFIALWTHADDQGVFPWKPKTIKMELRPASTSPIEPLLEEMLNVGCIRRFTINEREYGAVRNFRRHQRPKTPNAIHPCPPEIAIYVGLVLGIGTDSSVSISEIITHQVGGISEIAGDDRAQFLRSVEIGAQMEDGGDKREDEEDSPQSPPGEAVGDATAFAKFWEAYPHRDGLLDPEDDARAAFSKAIEAGTPAAEIIAGAECFASAVREHKVEPTKINQAKSWLAKKGWRSGVRKARPIAPVKGTAFSSADLRAFLPTDSERRDWEMAVGLFYRTGEWRGRAGKPGTVDYRGPPDLLSAAHRGVGVRAEPERLQA